MIELPADALRNRERWTLANAEYADARAADKWAAAEITWGVFGIPESSLGTLGEVAGLDVVELGCGTAYVSAWLARRGARAVGVDVTPAQLATARRCQAAFGLDFPLVEASAEAVPLAPESFDLAVSEYGASIWCDPSAWLPEAHRLLRPGGRLWFLRTSPLFVLCARQTKVGFGMLCCLANNQVRTLVATKGAREQDNQPPLRGSRLPRGIVVAPVDTVIHSLHVFPA